MTSGARAGERHYRWRCGFDGCAVVEYEGNVDNPAPALKQCVEAVRSAAKG